MEDSESGRRLRALLRQVGAACAGLALVLLVWAAGLALWSRLWAPRTLHDSDWQGYIAHLHQLSNSMPNAMAIMVCAASTVLLGATALSLWRGSRGRDGALNPVLWVGLFVVAVFGYFSVGIPAFYEKVMADYPVTPALPAGVGAWVLGAIGAVAALVAAVCKPTVARGSVRLLSVGAALGLVTASATTVAAVRAGDDSRYVDASTAAAVAVPPFPTAMGDERFTLTVPNAFDTEGFPDPLYRIASAGAGFVLANAGRVTAYGADGTERWHYQRTGPGDAPRVRGIRVFDDGATVVAYIGGNENGLAALDAVTGERLWYGGGDEKIDAAFQSSGLRYFSPFMVFRGEKEWTRYDTRTGGPMWTVAAPHRGCAKPVNGVDTAERIVSLTRCYTDERLTVWLTVLDPATGATLWDVALVDGLPQGSTPYDTNDRVTVLESPVSRVGVFVRIQGDTQSSRQWYVNVVDQTVTDIPEGMSLAGTVGPADDFVGTVYDRERRQRDLTLFDASGAEKCTLSGVDTVGNLVPGYGDDAAYVSFADSVVVAHRDGDWKAVALQSFDASCRQIASRLTVGYLEGFVPMPGAVLVLRAADDHSLEIEGYSAD